MKLGNIVKQHNDFIRKRIVVNNLISGRVLACLVSLIHTNDSEFKEYSIRAIDVIKNDDGGKCYKELDHACNFLVNVVYKEARVNSSFLKMPLFQKMLFENGILTVKFNPELKPFLLNLKSHFTNYSLEEYLSLPSIYSQKLFEVLKSWSDCPEVIILLSELQDILNVPSSFLSDFTNFRRRVLDKSHKDIHEKTSLKYEWEAIKTRNKVTAIRFIFSKKGIKITKKSDTKKVTEKFIMEQAKPGETWQETRKRLSNKNSSCINKISEIKEKISNLNIDINHFKQALLREEKNKNSLLVDNFNKVLKQCEVSKAVLIEELLELNGIQ